MARDPLGWIDEDKLVTLTLRAGDIQEAILAIGAAHGEFCILTDKCDCINVEKRIVDAWEKADPSPLLVVIVEEEGK